MAGIYGVSAYQQANQAYRSEKIQSENAKTTTAEKTGQVNSTKENKAEKTETKGYSPIDTKSSLVPKSTEYGNTIGDVKLSEKAKDYYNKLKSKFHNMEFIAVSKDMKSQVQANLASYGNANKQVVLIDDEKLERMAEDESYRKKYEGIIAMSSAKLTEAKNSLAASGASVKNFGMSVDSNGKESFFATVDKSKDQQKKRIEKKAAEKKEQKIKEKKKAEKEAKEERLQKSRDARKTEKTGDKKENETKVKEPETEIFEADSMDGLLAKVREFSYANASDRVMTNGEMMVGSRIDFKG